MVMLMMLVIKLMIMLMVMMLVMKLIIMLNQMVMMECGGGRTNQIDYLEPLIRRHQAGSQIHQEERVVLEEHNAFSTQTITQKMPPLIEMDLTIVV